MSAALLFPGQGAQRRTMFDAAVCAPERETFERAAMRLGFDVRERAADPAFLASTLGAQLATFVASVASARALAAAGVAFDGAAGHSVGLYAALVATGALDFEAALVLVVERATLMARAFPAGFGMAAIAGLPEKRVAEIARAADPAAPPAVAVTNAAEQFALAGEVRALERAVDAALASGARRALLLDIAVPSHAPLLDGVATALAPAIDAAAIRAPRTALVRGTNARIARTEADVRDELHRELRVPLRWHDATRVLYERGARLFIQMPPGDALADLAGAAFADARAVAVERIGIGGARTLALKAT